MISTIKTYLKPKEDKAKNDEEEKRLELFESLNCTTDFRCQKVVPATNSTGDR